MALDRTDREYWMSYAGIVNSVNEPLTKTMIRDWAGRNNQQIECSFCGETKEYRNATDIYCNKCKEYKGMIPYIPEWSDQG